MSLDQQSCVPCKGGMPPMEPGTAESWLKKLPAGWTLTHDATRLEKTFTTADMPAGLAFVSRLVDVAQKEGHHPDVHLSIRAVRVEVWTHKIGGLHESDFIYAAKADKAFG